MKEKKNVFLLLGTVLSVMPLISNIVRSLIYIKNYTAILPYVSADDMLSSMIVDALLPTIVNVVLIVLMVILAVLQLRCNTRKHDNYKLPIIGIIASSLCLVYTVFSVIAKIPSAIIHQSLDLLSVRYFINELFIHLVFVGIIGFVLLVIAYIKSLPKRK